MTASKTEQAKREITNRIEDEIYEQYPVGVATTAELRSALLAERVRNLELREALELLRGKNGKD